MGHSVFAPQDVGGHLLFAVAVSITQVHQDAKRSPLPVQQVTAILEGIEEEALVRKILRHYRDQADASDASGESRSPKTSAPAVRQAGRLPE